MKSTKNEYRRRDVLKGMTALGGLSAVAAVTGFPHVARAEAKTIRVGMPTILSGRVAVLGESSANAAQLVFDRINAGGGIAGRTLELVTRDSKGKPDAAARNTRDLINSDGCEIIIDAEASSGAFAVQEVIRELPVLCLHTCSETSALTADPKLRVDTAFRSARQGIHDAIGGGQYAAKLAKEKSLDKWMTCSPDYAYGRDNSAQFLEYAKKFHPSLEVVEQVWPKLFEPDYTTFVTRILQVKPQALYSALWGGDLVSFIEQGNLYGLFAGNMAFFSGGLADPPILKAIKQLPSGLNSVYRYDPAYPKSEANADFNAGYEKEFSSSPTNWSWQAYTAVQFIAEALKRTSGKTDGKALANEVRGMVVDSPFAPDGKIEMRASDQTIIKYPVAWGQTVASPVGMADWVPADWAEIETLEADWKKEQGYT